MRNFAAIKESVFSDWLQIAGQEVKGATYRMHVRLALLSVPGRCIPPLNRSWWSACHSNFNINR